MMSILYHNRGREGERGREREGERGERERERGREREREREREGERGGRERGGERCCHTFYPSVHTAFLPHQNHHNMLLIQLSLSPLTKNRDNNILREGKQPQIITSCFEQSHHTHTYSVNNKIITPNKDNTNIRWQIS